MVAVRHLLAISALAIVATFPCWLLTSWADVDTRWRNLSALE